MGRGKLKKLPSSDTMGTLELLSTGGFWGRIKVDWDGDDPIYKGTHVNHDADGSENDWMIFKYTWSSDNPVDTQVQTGIWDNRVSLSW